MKHKILPSLLRMFKLACRYPKRLAWFAVASIVYSALTSSFALLFKMAMSVLENRNSPDWSTSMMLPDWLTAYIAVPDMKLRKAFFLILAITAAVLALRCVSMYFRRYLQSWLTQKIVVDTQNDLASHLLNHDLNYFHKERSGELLSRMTNDLLLLGESVKLTCVFVTRPITLVFSLVVVFVLNWQLAVFGMLTAPIAGVAIAVLSKKMRQAAKRVQEKRADITSVMIQFLSGIQIVKAFGCEDFETKQFGRENQKYFDVCMKRERARSRVRPVVEFTSALSALIVLAIGGEWYFRGKWLLGHQSLELSDLFAFLAALVTMYQPAKELSRSNSDLQVALPGAERVYQIFDLKPQVREGTYDLADFENEIRIENVSFDYVSGTPVLRDIDLTIRKGECIALVGPSGVGKSTLTDLVLRFYDPTQGRITLDDKDLRKLSFDSIRKQIALVSQEPFLFNCSVRDNIAYGRADASVESIEAAARAAGIHDEILALPDGYDTNVGERGDNLSGGQRQRVAIARAIFKDAPILILDEATSSLDSKSEKLVQDALEHLMQNRTSIVIAHRLSTVRHADRIVVLGEGRIVAQGSHDELMETCDVYAHLVQLQAGGSDRQKVPIEELLDDGAPLS